MQFRKSTKLIRAVQTIRRKSNDRRGGSSKSGNVLPSIWQDFCEFTTLHGIKNMCTDFRYLNETSATTSLPKK